MEEQSTIYYNRDAEMSDEEFDSFPDDMVDDEAASLWMSIATDADAVESDEDAESPIAPNFSPVVSSSDESTGESHSSNSEILDGKSTETRGVGPEWVGFKIVGDNIDKTVRPRHQTLDKQTQSLHYFHSYAVRDRIDFSSFSEIVPQVDLDSFDFETFLPTTSEDEQLKSNFSILIARILTRHVSAFTSFSDIVPNHIVHQYHSEMSKKSEVVSL